MNVEQSTKLAPNLLERPNVNKSRALVEVNTLLAAFSDAGDDRVEL